MITLAEWLQAQLDIERVIIDEADRLSKEYDNDNYEPKNDLYANGAESSGDSIVAMHPVRALAELESKQEILELCNWLDITSDGKSIISNNLKQFLAHPYKHRNGWQTEWEMPEL